MENRLYRVFVGSDNNTHELATDKIKSEATKLFPAGYTYYETQGVWNGGSEKSAIIEIITDFPRKVKSLARILKQDLEQQAVLIQSLTVQATFE